MERKKKPNLRNGTKAGFEPGLTRLRVRHSTTELPRSTNVDEGQFISRCKTSETVPFCVRCSLFRGSTTLYSVLGITEAKK